MKKTEIICCLVVFSSALTLRLWDIDATGGNANEHSLISQCRRTYSIGMEETDDVRSWKHQQKGPPLAQWIYGLALNHEDGVQRVRLLSAIMGSLSILLLFLIGLHFFSLKIAFFAAMIAVAHPQLLAFHRAASIASLGGVFFLAGVLFFFHTVKCKGNSPNYLLAGFFAGLAIATDFTTLTILGLFLWLYWVSNVKNIRQTWHLPLPVTLAIMPLVIMIILFVAWPYLWHDPMSRLGKALVPVTNEGIGEYFFGKKGEPPWFYGVAYWLATTPASVLLLAFIGCGRCLYQREMVHWGVIGWLVVVLSVSFFTSPRGGMDAFYPSVWATCLLAALGAEFSVVAVCWFTKRTVAVEPLLAILGTLVVLATLHASLSVHPYYSLAYNALVGGPAGIAERNLFIFGEQGEGVADGVAFISRAASDDARVWIAAEPAHWVQLRPELKRVQKGPADFVLCNRLGSVSLTQDYHIVYRVRAGGVPLVWVYQRMPEDIEERL